MLEAVFARGDRRLSKVIYDAYKAGAIFDAWTEFFSMERYHKVFEENNVDIKFYTERERDIDEVFPWDHIDAGVTKAFLKKEWLTAKEGKVTLNCRDKCQGCGGAAFGSGVCFGN